MEWLKEKNYFFKMSSLSAEAHRLHQRAPRLDRARLPQKRNPRISAQALNDLCISRPQGAPFVGYSRFPFDPGLRDLRVV